MGIYDRDYMKAPAARPRAEKIVFLVASSFPALAGVQRQKQEVMVDASL